MRKTLSLLLLSTIVIAGRAQTPIIVTGTVVHSTSMAPLTGAVVRQNKDENQTLTDASGKFTLTILRSSDTLIVSHVGFRTSYVPLKTFSNESRIKLEEYSLELKTVTITSRQLDLKEIEGAMRVIRDNLYAHEAETTNELYNLFLSALEESESADILQRCNYDLRGYDEQQKEFYQLYSKPSKAPRKKKDTASTGFANYPAVNVPHEGAVLFCEWLTMQYNTSTTKKRFKKVKFRLPTLSEWQIAALGYPKFQSWKLDENFVEVVIPPDTIAGLVKGNKSKVPVGDFNVWYPWYNAYNYRKKPYNHMACYLGNFKVDATKPVCNNIIRPGGDGWTKMSSVAAYFPNDMGLYDVVGNVAEMIDENFKACGGSWNDIPAHSTIRSVKTFRKANDTVGFRIFMEVIEK